MRITGGQAKGRSLLSLPGDAVRPTSSKVRESLFNLIGQDLTGCRVLDLYAGTGILGIEALSRGALWVLFVDNAEPSLRLIRRNLRACGYEHSGSVVRKDLRKGLPRGPDMQQGFDLILIDPPYGKDMVPPLLGAVVKHRAVRGQGVVVAQSSNKDSLPEEIGPLRRTQTKIYGATKLDIFEYGSRP